MGLSKCLNIYKSSKALNKMLVNKTVKNSEF